MYVQIEHVPYGIVPFPYRVEILRKESERSPSVGRIERLEK